MTNYPGSFAGSVKTIPSNGVNYVSEQQVYICVKQSGLTLASLVLSNVDHLSESTFKIDFDYANVSNPCQLIFELRGDEIYDRDFPIELCTLEVDELYLTPSLKYIGQVIVNDQVLDTGNTLWCTGKLVYNFLIPVSQMVFVRQ